MRAIWGFDARRVYGVAATVWGFEKPAPPAGLDEAAKFYGAGDSWHTNFERSLAVSDSLGNGSSTDFVAGLENHLLELGVHLVLVPVELLDILGPLDVRNDDTTRVDQNVR